MVLNRTTGTFAFALLAACITARPPPRAPHLTPVTVALVIDREDGRETAPPETVTAAIKDSLATRNLAVSGMDIRAAAAGRRTTVARLKDMAQRATDSQALVLVEMRVIFDSQIDTKYRWSIYSKATIARGSDLSAAMTQQKTFSAFLDFDHEREPEAVAAAASQIVDQVTRLTDDLLSDTQAAPAPHAQLVVPLKDDPPAPSNADAVYFVMVDRFANGDASNDGAVDRSDPQAFHGGDLQGITQRLDYLQDLGVGAVWISPVFKTRGDKIEGHGAFHGYWVQDFGEIDPRFGGEAALVRLSEELHRRGMKLYLDVVLNHVGYDAPLTKSHPEWFHHNGDIRDWNDPTQLENNDVHGLPDLAQERVDVYDYLLKTSIHWIDMVHPDGFRLDAVKHIPAAFWAKYNDDIHRHAGPGFVLLGEDLDGHVPELSRMLRAGHFNSLFDFPLHFALVDVFCKDASPEKLAAVLSEDRRYAHPERLATLLDNHDLPRITTACGGDVNKVRQALTFLLLGRGVPVLQYGTESALTGENEPENRGDMKFYGPLTGHVRHLLNVRGQLSDLVQKPCIYLVAPGAFACVRRNGSRALVVAVNSAATTSIFPLPKTHSAVIDLESGDVAVGGEDVASARFIGPGSTEALLIHTPDPADLDPWIAELGMHEGEMMLAFKIQGVPAMQPGDRLFLSGSGEELGDWKCENGVAFDSGLTATAKLPANAVFEAKLVIRHSDGSLQWEEGSNRYIYYADNSANRCLAWSHGDCSVM